MDRSTEPKKRPSAAAVASARRKGVAPSKTVLKADKAVRVTRSITIRQPPARLYAFWRNLENLAQIIKHPVTIKNLSGLESHWSASAPGDRCVEWDALIIAEDPDQLIAWRSREDSDVANAGSVRFDPAPDGDGTEVTVTVEYDPPGGKLTELLAKLTGKSVDQQVAAALKRLKILMEDGPDSEV